jgi:hypothetical protein
MIFTCCSTNRRNAILNGSAAAPLNGIDYLEVQLATSTATGTSTSTGTATATGSPTSTGTATATGSPTATGSATVVPTQATLLIHCLLPVQAPTPPTSFTSDNALITGGERITNIGIASLAVSATDATVLLATTTVVGDFSPYRLRLVNSAQRALTDPFGVTEVLTGFDPQLAEVEFTFQPTAGPSFDCATSAAACSPPPVTPPPINYLAKDYGSFRTLILDRLNQLLPASVGNNEADLPVMLAELIAYRADLLSYSQDAVATEAYLETARSRISLRRHARLVGYHVHDGCNARAWVSVSVAADPGDPVLLDHTLTRFYTYAPGMPATLAVGAGNETQALAAGVQVFEPMHDALLYHEHNLINFYTWGETQCCLPAGAVEATLQGAFPNLQTGAVLIFKEVIGPQTGNAADADPAHRCAVRLTQVAHTDALGDPLVDPLYGVAITEIQWAAADAPTFPVCISSSAAANVTVVLGNTVLADHGLSLPAADLGKMPEPRFYYPPAAPQCSPPAAPVALPTRFRPPLLLSPVTQAVPLALAASPVTSGVVLLGAGSASLSDAHGLTALSIDTTNPAAWPALFGVLAQQNATTAANIDLSVVYAPTGGAAGMSGPVVMEHFTGLSFVPAEPNYVVTAINELSNLIRIPASYAPPGTPPTAFSTSPTLLIPGQAVTLSDQSSAAVAFLTVQPTSPLAWPADVGILVEDLDTEPPAFNLAVVYYPPSPLGVALPVVLEQFSNVAQSTLAPQINTGSGLLRVQSFAGMPDTSQTAQELLTANASGALPSITLQGTYEGVTNTWMPQQDLLSNGPDDRVFVVEVEADGTAYVRFATPGDPSSPLETNGLVPPANTTFAAGYRVGNGSAGNVGAESLILLAAADARIQSCINPMSAAGGTDPETNDQIRRRAPQAFLSQAPSTLMRAVTMADYEAVAENQPQVNQAVASLRWTGSWYSVFIAVEPVGGGGLAPALQQRVASAIDACRLAGQDIQLEPPQYVSLQIALTVTVADTYFRSDVASAVLQALSNRLLPNGQPGLFYPGNFTFGQSVYLSPIYAAVRAVAGVASVMATEFQPQGVDTAQYLNAGEISLGSLQVARLDNDPSYPDHGQVVLTLLGGR